MFIYVQLRHDYMTDLTDIPCMQSIPYRCHSRGMSCLSTVSLYQYDIPFYAKASSQDVDSMQNDALSEPEIDDRNDSARSAVAVEYVLVNTVSIVYSTEYMYIYQVLVHACT